MGSNQERAMSIIDLVRETDREIEKEIQKSKQKNTIQDDVNKLLDNAAELIALDEEIIRCQQQLAELHGIEIKIKKTEIKAEILKKIADIIESE